MATLAVELAFLGERFGQAVDPDAALRDIISLIERLDPRTIDVTHRIEADHCATRIEIGFDPGQDDACALVKAAVIRGEGLSGYVATFCDPGKDAVAEPGWLYCSGRLVAPVLPGNIGFGVALPLVDMLPALMREMALAGARFGYRLRLQRNPAAPWAASALVPALAAARAGRGAIARLEGPIAAALQLTRAAGWAATEYLMVHEDSAEGCASAIEAALIHNLAHCCPGMAMDVAAIDWSDTAAVPQGNGAATLDVLVAERRPRDYLRLAVGTALETLASALGRIGPAPAPPSHPGTPPAAPGAPFAFLSYAHRDRPHAERVAQGLRARGLMIWYDEGIAGGALWDECLEQRIRDADLLIACLSPAFEASRYCRREIKFADMLHKPILPLSPDACEWGPGLALSFGERQILFAAVPVELDRICSHALALAPRVRTH